MCWERRGSDRRSPRYGYGGYCHCHLPLSTRVYFTTAYCQCLLLCAASHLSCECRVSVVVLTPASDLYLLKIIAMTTGQLIKELRLKKGITQEDLAAKTDISVRTIQRIESGEVDPRAYTLQSIAAALEVDFEILARSETEASLTGQQENSRWLPVLHLSGLLLLIVPPIIIWIWKRDKVEGIRRHAIDVINFQLSMTLYLLPLFALSVYPVFILLAFYSQVIIIVNTVRVTSNRPYKYYLNIRFLKQEPAAETVVL